MDVDTIVIYKAEKERKEGKKERAQKHLPKGKKIVHHAEKKIFKYNSQNYTDIRFQTIILTFMLSSYFNAYPIN